MNIRFSALFIPLFATTLLAQNVPSAPTAPYICGPEDVTYTVKLSDGSAISAPAPGMATLVLIEDQINDRPGHAICLKCATLLKFAVDGQWIAATHGFSHTTVSIAPGDHHFCATGIGPVFSNNPLPSMFSLHTEAGKTYFLSGRLALYYGYNVSTLDLSQLNEDQGRYLVSISRQSLFTQK